MAAEGNRMLLGVHTSEMDAHRHSTGSTVIQ
jgi:hypothetical protein